MNYPQAKQVATGSNHVRRNAICPEHGRQSSNFRGIQMNLDMDCKYWAFGCKSRGGHIFLAIPPADVPQTVDNVTTWEEKQLAAKTSNYDAGGRSPRNPDGSFAAGR